MRINVSGITGVKFGPILFFQLSIEIISQGATSRVNLAKNKKCLKTMPAAGTAQEDDSPERRSRRAPAATPAPGGPEDHYAALGLEQGDIPSAIPSVGSTAATPQPSPPPGMLQYDARRCQDNLPMVCQRPSRRVDPVPAQTYWSERQLPQQVAGVRDVCRSIRIR